MLRLTVLLCAFVFTTLLIAGSDHGQMRPGLARATAEGQPITVVTRQFSAPVQMPDVPEFEPTAALPAPIRPAVPAPVATAAQATPAAKPDAPAPVFTLSALPGLGGDQASLGGAASAAADHDHDQFASQQASDAAGIAQMEASTWYVNADSVNVRQGPSTRDAVVERLINGEAVTVLGDTSAAWVRVTIQGDGVDGWVATRFLTPY